MLIRKLDRNTYDIFGDVGFDNWTRVRRFHWGIKPIAGVFVPRPVLNAIAAAISSNSEGSTENINAA